MRISLPRAVAIAAFSFFLMAPVAAQRFLAQPNDNSARSITPVAAPTVTNAAAVASPTPVVTVKDNGKLKFKKMSLFFKRPQSTIWEPAFGNYFVPKDAEYLKFRIQLNDPSVTDVKFRLEIRQICSVKQTPDLGVAQEQEIFATNTKADGNNITSTDGNFDLEIKVHPPDGGLTHSFPHCFENPDHLGEGPHRTSISFGEGSSLLDGNDSLHVVYSEDFRTVSNDDFDRMRGSELMKFLDKQRETNRSKSKMRHRP